MLNTINDSCGANGGPHFPGTLLISPTTPAEFCQRNCLFKSLKNPPPRGEMGPTNCFSPKILLICFQLNKLRNSRTTPSGEKRTLSQTCGPDGKVTSRLAECDLQDEGQNYTQRMESKMDKLRMGWSGSDYETWRRCTHHWRQ